MSLIKAGTQTMEEAFPDIKPMVTALGNLVLVQMKSPKRKSAGGIWLTESDTQFDADQIRVGRVVQLGPLAYKNRESLKDWPEGAWVKPGDYIRTPAHANIDKWIFNVDDDTTVIFKAFNDYDCKVLINGDPLSFVDYV